MGERREECDVGRPLNGAGCTSSTPAPRPTRVFRTTGATMAASNPGQKRSKTALFKKYGVPIIATVLVIAALVVIGVLIKVVLDNYYFFCSKSFKFIRLDKWCDGVQDCSEGQDEMRCVESIDITTPSAVRIANTRSLLEANIQLSGTWGLVCFDSFDVRKAKAVCANLGFSSDPTFSSVALTDISLQLPVSTMDVTSNGGIQTTAAAGSCQTVVSISCQNCGSSRNRERIIGGSSTSIQNWPWQVSLQYQGAHICGGSLINSRWILSAAHCFPDGQHQVDRWRVQEGVSSLSLMFATPVDQIFIHSHYKSRAYDIALLKLKKDLTLSEFIQPICLPPFDLDLPAGTKMWVTGWGDTKEGSNSVASALQAVSIDIIALDKCQSEYPGQITETMLCAGRLAGGADTCQGDSGGPLVHASNDQHWEQVGIVSFGEGCGRPGKVGVYTEVSAFMYWISGVMRSAA